MARLLKILGAQAAPHPTGAPFARFADEARALIAAHPDTDLLAFPELHLFHAEAATPAEAEAILRRTAVPLDGALDEALAALAAELDVILVPGTLAEAGPQDELFNTVRVYGRDGARLATYRKVFPWRPTEPFDPGADWVAFDCPLRTGGLARIGLTICYDAWFPEATRQVAWLGAELVLNLVKTTTLDRPQELVLARANAIVNQVFMISLNCPGPVGKGHSLFADPEGAVIAESGSDPVILPCTVDLDQVRDVRATGTCGENRMWAQFRPGEARIALPAYGGAIDPANWDPATRIASEGTPA